MCGIVGSISPAGDVDRDRLIRQRDTLTHRGPDDAGCWVAPCGRVGFGHRRLAILDLSAAGHQPMVDPATGCVLAFNGEIYNFATLRERLEAAGHAFVSRSDTEVLLRAYLAWGEEAIPALEGMFAFALYDPRRQAVLLARDRAGEKPLYLTRGPWGVHFASEVKALWADPRVPRRIDPDALEECLAYGYPASGTTLLRDIVQLPPASAAWVDLDSGRLRQWSYWSLPTHAPDGADDPHAREAALEALMRDAVGRQLVADVPVGVLLSGGLDSSVIAALAAQVPGVRLRTFTVAFPDDPTHDESHHARAVADHLGTRHEVIEAAPASADLLDALATQFDDPIADSSMIPTYLISRAIRQHVTVALGGDGGDELFGGYLRHARLVHLQALRRRIPAPVRSAMAAVASHAPASLRGRTTLQGLGAPGPLAVALAGRLTAPDTRRALVPLLRDRARQRFGTPELRRARRISDRPSVLQQATALDFLEYLPGDVLTKVDRASMLASLEVRAPLLDPRLVHAAFAELPDHERATAHARKVILRRIATRLLPAGFDVTRKQGFSVPLHRWMQGAWRPVVDSALDDAPTWLLDRDEGRRLQRRVAAGEPLADTLFGVVMLSRWAQRYGVST